MTEDSNLHDPTRAETVAAVPRGLSERWAADADRAFSSALDRPDVYQRSTRLIGALTDVLRQRSRGLAGLVRDWELREQVLAQAVATDPRLTLEGLDTAAVLGAAFTMRRREAAQESAEDRRVAFLAGMTGTDWVVVEEEGYAPGDPFVPYRRLEVHVPAGLAIAVSTMPDETMMATTHHVQLLRLQPDTGRLQDIDGNDPVDFGTAEEREAYVSDLRRQHSRPEAGPPSTC
jgi:hypothetical protein